MAKTEKKKYPIGAEFYELYEEIGQGVSASVRRALCVPLNDVVAIKILDFERDNIDLNNISREAQTMVLIDHPNVLKSHCSFVSDHNLWVVMPYMAGGSCLHILKAAYPDGFEEVVIATVLREVLKGLEYLHSQGHIHRDVKAGNVLIDGKGATKLGDFGVSACLFDSGDRQRMRNTFVGTPCWMAPEVMEQLHGYDFKADIWSFGITALELAHGHAPFSKYPPMKVLLMTLQNAPPGLDYERDKKFSKSFKQMIASCLVKDPSKRPSARKLLKHPFFRQSRSNDYIARTLLEGLPALGDRIQALKRKEEDMLAQKKIPDGQKEEMSQNEYKRGISGWNFNLDDMKAQASLIQDVDEPLSDNNIGGSSNSLCALDGQEKQLHYVSSSDAEDNDIMQNRLSRLPSANLTRSILNTLRCDRSDDDSSTAGYLSHTSSPRQFVQSENYVGEKPDTEIIKRSLEGVDNNIQQRRGSSPGSNFLPDVITPSNRAESGDAVSLAGDEILHEISSQASKTSVNSDDLEEKPKVSVVQQRGRFKVTSENVELQKVASSPLLQKCHSMQVLSQHGGTSLTALSSPTEASSSTSALSVPYFFQLLISALQSNIGERDKILSMMKLVATDPAAFRTVDAAQAAAIEKPLLEASNEREKDLLNELTDMQRRLISVQDELQKYKTDNTQV